MIRELKALASLQTTHYSFPIAHNLLDPISLEVREYVRITRGLSLHPAYHNEQCVRNAVELCQEFDATLAINYSPYHMYQTTAADFGESYFDELQRMAYGLFDLREWIGNAVPVKMILLECERYWVWPQDTDEHKANVILKYNIVYDLCKAVFLDATVEWYKRGHRRLREGSTGQYWERYCRFTEEERGDHRSCELYAWTHPDLMWETWRRMVAGLKGDETANAWVSLGAGWTTPVVGDDTKWIMNYDYRLAQSRFAGYLLNQVWKPNAVVFYPAPFDHRTPHWTKHFIEYVKGATA